MVLWLSDGQHQTQRPHVLKLNLINISKTKSHDLMHGFHDFYLNVYLIVHLVVHSVVHLVNLVHIVFQYHPSRSFSSSVQKSSKTWLSPKLRLALLNPRLFSLEITYIQCNMKKTETRLSYFRIKIIKFILT